eukprot:CAMPEP_0206230662 /NCGR_PEP_ID=MMETSP0047_2-20121206/10391_1 /ASSEMBLY_ACC=CAM_ASM_000192 /TAXON_ID=195065 /ORGANISM="Chroomonas mesostigmatica_cf, Strain CCMP1168" /LENGTH=474 /DNA_ID=CAMNT_0053654125 /DNA_START=12 /DNA_END=1436 /DNA_ORIENTATION=-
MADKKVEELVIGLFEVGAVKFGEFKLKSGIMSPVYFDLRVTVSYPKLLRQISEQLWAAAADAKFDVMCGVPYTALPFASAMSVDHDMPMVLRRKEAKDYGTKKMIEGVYEQGAKCLIVEDVVTSGMSVLETSASLKEEGLNVTHAVVLLDREQGGPERIADGGVTLKSVLTVSKFIEVLENAGKLDAATAGKVRDFVKANQFDSSASKKEAPPAPPKSHEISYAKRAETAGNATAKKLLSIMEEKHSNLSVAADLNTCKEVLALADAVGPHVCLLKTHVDVMADFTLEFASELNKLAEKHNFLIFEDRKFADIGNTVSMQYGGGLYKIADWSHITNAHGVPGPGIIDGLAEVGLPKGRGLLMLGEMSSSGTLAAGAYTEATVKMAMARRDFCMGFICTHKLCDDVGMIHMTPGVQLKEGTDNLGQRYLTPDVVIRERLSDVIIVGRGVYKADDPAKAAIEYKEKGWAAYTARLK